jgi:ADP-glucose pyrophosphorylase
MAQKRLCDAGDRLRADCFDSADSARNTLALVLAGGKGSRLFPLTEHQCKPAVPFDGAFRIVDFGLSNCINSGIRRIGVLSEYQQHSLLLQLRSGWRLQYQKRDHRHRYPVNRYPVNRRYVDWLQ